MSTITPLLVAFFGALFGSIFGAYFALFKTRRQTQWTDRYEILKKILLHLDTIGSYYSSKHTEERGISVISGSEQDILLADLSTAQRELGKNFTILRLLFTEKDIDELLESYQDLHNQFFELFNESHVEIYKHFEAISSAAHTMSENVISFAQSKQF